ncbi:MAG: DNA internalization-related competence protein ComEC/Rec2 [Negativicutes bacterium]|nr:DNA internalization-related competence protein ComEC/Rec2 [Negativicutes bacterium]
MKIMLPAMVCLAFAGGIRLAGATAWPAVYFLTATLLAAAAAAAGWQRWRWPAWVLLLVACLAAGGFRYSWYNALPADDIGQLTGQDGLTVTGTVAEVPLVVEESAERRFVRYQLDVRTVAGGRDDEPRPASGRILVGVEQLSGQELLVYGSEVKVRGQLQDFAGYRNFGAADSNRYFRHQGLAGRMAVRFDDIEILSPGDIGAWKVVLADWRQRVRQEMLTVMPEDDAALLNGMVFGGYGGIERQVTRDFSVSGLVHILSVSGSHVALVGGTVLWLSRWWGWRFGSGALLAILAIVGYGAVAGWTPAVVRAVIMGSLTLIGAILGRDRSAAHALAITCLLMLAADPNLAYSVSFLLSASATAGLVAFYRRSEQALGRLPRWLAVAVAATWSAQLGSLPFLAGYFNSLSLVSIPANILALPAIDVALVTALTAAVMPGFLFFVAKPLYIISSIAVGWTGNVAALLAAVPGSVLHVPAMPAAVAVGYYLLVLWWYGYLVLPGRRWSGVGRTVAVLGLAAAGCLGVYAVNRTWDRPLAAHFIDVGQGDAALIVTPHRQAVLIDTGGVSRHGFDVGERVVAPYLLNQGIDHLAALILTHAHNDHAGGAAAIEAAIDIDEVIIPQGTYSPRLQAMVNSFGPDWVVPARDGQQFTVDGVTFTIIMDNDTPAGPDKPGRENARQAVVAVGYRQIGMLVTGDLTVEGERQLLPAGKIRRFDVLKVGHHGSAGSSSAEFLATVQPRYAVISVGADNGYGHPAPETLQRLQAAGAEILRTDRDGAVIITTDGYDLAVRTYNSDNGEK